MTKLRLDSHLSQFCDSVSKFALSLNSINNFVFAMEIRSVFHASVTDNSNV